MYGLFLFILIAASVGIYLLSMILPCISGDEKYHAISSILPLAILIIIISSHARMLYEYYDCFKKPVQLIYFTLIKVLCFFAMIYWMNVEWGLKGVFYALIVAHAAGLIVALGYTFRNRKLI